MEINTNILEATIRNEAGPQLKVLVDALKAGTATDDHADAFLKAMASGVIRAIVQAVDGSARR